MGLFITDYDGTLFVDDELLEENISMLKELQRNNFKIVISTGRSYPSIKNQVDTKKIPYDYLSCADGSVVYDNKGEIIKMHVMNKELIIPFQEFYKDLDYEEIQFSYPEGYYNYYRENNNELLGINVCLATINYNKDIVTRFLKMKKRYPKYNFLNYMHPNFSYLCIKPKGVTKAATISYLKDILNIKKKDIYVIGDSYNDFEMIKAFHGCCMETSCDEIIKIAKRKYNSVSSYIKDILKED